jgi:hypothetical protein
MATGCRAACHIQNDALPDSTAPDSAVQACQGRVALNGLRSAVAANVDLGQLPPSPNPPTGLSDSLMTLQS